MNNINTAKQFIMNLEEITETILPDNKKSISDNIRNMFLEKSEQLIGELISHPEQDAAYFPLGHRLKKIDPEIFEQYNTAVQSIQKIAQLLREGDTENLNSFSSHISGSNAAPKHLPPETTTSVFFHLRLPDDIERVRTIPHPDVRVRIMAQLINRDEIPLRELNLSKPELMALGPHLTYLDCRNFNTFPPEEMQSFLDSCTHLKSLVINSPRIARLPPLPHCQTLNCSGCIFLRELPPLPNCRLLNCSNCRLLRALPQLTNCIDLKCFRTAIEELPPLPNCDAIDCHNNNALRQLSEIPRCRTLNYESCPLLNPNMIPIHLRNNIIAAPLRRELAGFQVSIDDLNKNPFKILLSLSPRLLEGYSLPRIQLVEIDGSIAEGIDAAGLSRILISRLMQALILHAEDNDQLSFIKDENGLMPVLNLSTGRLNEYITGFRSLGALFVLSLKQSHLIGNVFNTSVFQLISSLSYDTLAAIPIESVDLSDQLRIGLMLGLSSGSQGLISKFARLLQTHPFKLKKSEYEELRDFAVTDLEDNEEPPPDLNKISFYNKIWVHSRVKKILIQNRKQSDTLFPVVIMAKQMQILAGSKAQWDEWCLLGAQGLQDKIEGVLTKEMFDSAIIWESSEVLDDAKVEKIKGFITQLIEEYNIEELKDLVFTITGLTTLTATTFLKFNIYNMAENRLPVAHVCFSSIDFSANCPDYETFKKNMDFLIKQSTNKDFSGTPLA